MRATDKKAYETMIAEVKKLDRASFSSTAYQELIQKKAKALAENLSSRSSVAILTDMFLRRYQTYPQIPAERVNAVCKRFAEWLENDPGRLVYDIEDFLFSLGAPLMDWKAPIKQPDRDQDRAFAEAFNKLDKDDPEPEGITFDVAIHELSQQVHGDLEESILPQHNPHGLTRSEWIALSTYTGGHYGAINSALRSGKQGPYQAFIDTLNRALAKLPRARGTLYRGTKLPESVRALHQEGALVDYAAFTSASMSRSAAAFFGVEDFAIMESQSARVVNNFGALAGAESEALFPSGTKFRIRRVEVSEDGNRT